MAVKACGPNVCSLKLFILNVVITIINANTCYFCWWQSNCFKWKSIHLYTSYTRASSLFVLLKQDVCKLINPAIPTATVPEFLWDHINKDIDTLRIALGRSLDDVLMFLHSIIHLFVENEESYAGEIHRLNYVNYIT